ncbi:ABC transporter permease [Puniceicoccales bacterium CK1056]|uniref:ABC transporter permease n=1 Tax=Oceanipulchritudo coccoides TaxID=2706888 RepID=A0A6B2M1F5_9BACT|nr:ABC transporter permease [Oceanipulchritudo coccoides]NDV62758.1 ABC transporter permease [Oceanipulchritudo coccoides]
MRKILAVAKTEYKQVVLTKSFLVSLLFPLIIYGGVFVLSALVGDKTDLRDRVLVVADRTEAITEGLITANEERNLSDAVLQDGKQVGPRFVIQVYEGELLSDTRQLLVELSDQVRDGDIFAFALIGSDYLAVEGGDDDLLQYYSDSPTFSRLPNWLSRTTREIVEESRFLEAGYDAREINLLTSHNGIERFSLAEVDEEGNITEPKEENPLAAFLIPFGLVMLIFISIQMTTPILLNSVIEEKMQRIAEVLLSSLSPFQLLAGKLIAGVSVGLTFSAVYVLSLSLSLRYFERMEWVPQGTYFWFFLFLLTGMLAFGSLFAGVSSACQDLKDSQNFAGPIILLMVIPMMLSLVTIESPDGPFAVSLSLIPPFSIMAMMTRIAVPPGPPEWQIFLSLGLNLAFAFLVVWASSRMFRIGILSQGKTPTWKELVRWIFQRN